MRLQLFGQDDQPSLQDEAPLICTSVVASAINLPPHKSHHFVDGSNQPTAVFRSLKKNRLVTFSIAR